MVSPSLRVNQNIVGKYKYKLSQLCGKNMIHTKLESRWCIAKAKRHYQILIVAIVSPESCFMDVRLMHSYLVVTRP